MYKLSHPLDRLHQQEALEWIMASKKKYNIICSPTGSGKSAWAAAASLETKVMVLTKTKSLQSANYEGEYDFDPLYGKANYDCRDENNPVAQLAGWTAADCGRMDCQCRYQMQYRHCINSWRVSLNYAKWLTSGSLIEAAQPDILFLDEAHNLPDIVSEFIGLTLRWDNEFIQRRTVPKEPRILKRLEAMNYFKQCAQAVKKNKPDKYKYLKKWRKWSRLSQKIETINKIVGYSELDDWYYQVDEEKLLMKPLTAKYHFKALFDAPKMVLMSATINPGIAPRLGIDEKDINWLEIPNIWPVPTRIIYDLQGPRINYNSSEQDKMKQVELIASHLTRNDSGIIGVSSKAQAKNLQYQLRQKGIMTWLPENDIGTDRQLQQWYQDREPGMYCISWCFHEGVDLGEENIAVLAKVPYGDISQPYEKAKMEYDKEWYAIVTALSIEQFFGRIWRGKDEHYAGIKKAYIADSAYKNHQVYNKLSLDFRKRIRGYNGI